MDGNNFNQNNNYQGYDPNAQNFNQGYNPNAQNFNQGFDANATQNYSQPADNNAQNTASNYYYTPGSENSVSDSGVKSGKVLGICSVIIGACFILINLLMTCSMVLGGEFRFGGLFIILPIIGIVTSVKAKAVGYKGLGTTGLILNIVATVGSALFILIGIIATIFNAFA